METRPDLPHVSGLRVVDARPEPAPHAAGFFGAVERIFLLADRIAGRILPAEHNPLTHTGAIANVNFIVAAVTGALLLIWYVPSVGQAHQSLEMLHHSSLLGELMRSLHRYSSDACMLFVLLHAFRSAGERRFGGSRWLAWVTGVIAFGVLGFVGWLGYWLVWDERARLVAVGSSRMLDVLPFFSEPMSRSFVIDRTVNSLLFFVVFFVHMLIPLAMAVVLWLHITRLSRPRFLTNKAMTLWVLAALVIISLIHPATSAAPAKMLSPVHAGTIDGWFLLPLLLTERLAGGAMWGTALVATIVLLPLPWLFSKRRPAVAVVDTNHCNACQQCFKDCPYNAIMMVPRTDDRKFAAQAHVDADKCVGCGICAGACDPSAINLPWMPTRDIRDHVLGLIGSRIMEGETPTVAFLCSSAAGTQFNVEKDGRCAELPGYIVVPLTCAGWLHPVTVERALRKGAAGVLVVSCPEGACNYREGPKWLGMRLAGTREPALRQDKVDAEQIEVLHLSVGEREQLISKAAAFRARMRRNSRPVAATRARAIAGGVVVSALIGAATLGFSELPHPAMAFDKSLVVTFKHPGHSGESCRTLTEQEKAELPPHMMRDQVCERGRAPVRVRVLVDGAPVLEQSYAPKGIFGDGVSIAIEEVDVPMGDHLVEVQVGETSDPNEWTYEWQQPVSFIPGQRHAVMFERSEGFFFE